VLVPVKSGVRSSFVASLESVARPAGAPNGHGPAGAIGTLSRMTTDQKGAIAEMAIALRATLLGVDVFRPVTEGGRYDLIFDFGGKLWRVQCKWGSRYGDVLIARTFRARRNRYGLVRRLYTADEIDAFAIYWMEIDRCFFVPITYALDKQEVRLRLSPAKNNQRRGIHWADDFDFEATLRSHQGAVAQLGERMPGRHEVTGSSPVGSIS
jgi:PD-(D/E)XK endonuclease